MADIKISNLPPVSECNGSEMIPATQGTTPVKITVDNISNKVKEDILPIGTNEISDNSVSLNKFTNEAKEYIGSGGSITNYPDGVTLESYNDNGTNKIRIKDTAAEQLFSTGVLFDWNNSGTSLTRCGNTSLGQTIQDQLISPVVLKDDGTVNYELSEDVRYKKNGQPSDLSGADGQAMVRIKRPYIKRVFDSMGRITQLSVSLVPLNGFIPHESFTWGNGREEIFVGMFEASLVNDKLASVSGKPIYSNVTLSTFRTKAQNRGTGFYGQDLFIQDLVQSLWYIFFADMNSQVSLPGYTGQTYNQNYLRNTGRSIILTSKNGYVPADATIDSDIYNTSWTDSTHAIANRFFWIENFFGHVFKTVDGISIDGRISGNKHAFVTNNPTQFSSDQNTILNTYTDLGFVLANSSNEGWIKSFGKYFLPIEMGGGSSNYTSDYTWHYLIDNTLDFMRLVLCGGDLNCGLQAGVAARHSIDDLGIAYWNIGSRLCYAKN